MALSATVQWDVRTTGNDSNGGAFDPGVTSPGTDYSQQNSPQIAFTDLVIGATTTQLTSAAHPFGSTYVGNVINITSGTGFTVGRYTIVSVSGVTATMDRSVGTAASTGGNGNLGGSMLTIQAARTAASVSNTINIQAGTYTFTSVMSITQATLSFIGYQTTHKDGGTKPLITTSTNSTTLFETTTNGGIITLDNLSLSNTAATPLSGIWENFPSDGPTQIWNILNCKFSGFNIAIDNSNGAHDWIGFVNVTNTEVSNSTYGMKAFQNSVINGCYFHDNANNFAMTIGNTAQTWLLNSIFSKATTNGVLIDGTGIIIDHCTFANNTGYGLQISSSATLVGISNSIFYGNSTYGIQGAGGNAVIAGAACSHSNAFGNNTTANYTAWNGSPGDVSLTANPFTNSSGGDYSLNSTAGGGAVCKGGGFPGVFPGATSTGHGDIGAVQSGSGGGGGGVSSFAFLG